MVIRLSSQYHETLVSNPHVCATCQPSAEGSPSSAVLHLPSVIYPILTRFAPLCGEPAALRSLPGYLMGTRCPRRVSFSNRGQPRRGRRGSSVQSLPRGTGFPARGFGTGRTLRGRLNASRYDPRSAVALTWAGKPMPRGTGFPARGFGTGRTLRPPSRRPPFSPFPPVKNSSVCSVCSVGQPSVLRPPSYAVRR